MMDGSVTSVGSRGSGPTANVGSIGLPSAAFNVHQHLTEASRLFQQNAAAVSSYQAAAAAASAGVVSPFGGHMGALTGVLIIGGGGSGLRSCNSVGNGSRRTKEGAVNTHPGQHPGQSQPPQSTHPHSVSAAAAAAAAISAMGGHGPHPTMGQLPHGLAGPSQQIAAALFANSPLISDDLKLAAAAAAAAAAAQSARGKKTHRAEPVPQSGFKGVSAVLHQGSPSFSWNSRMKAWLAFYVTENGERKSKTFSTRKLGMEEARVQAIAFCKQKQDQRREARKRNREIQNQQHAATMAAGGPTGLDKLSSDESMMDSPASGLGHFIQNSSNPASTNASASSTTSAQTSSALRCAGYPTIPGMSPTIPGIGGMGQSPTQPQTPVSTAQNGSEIAYVPIVPIAMDMIEKSGLLQPLELNVLPPCQHCNKQPYPFLMIVSEGQEQTYSGSSIMSLASHGQGGVGIPQQSEGATTPQGASQSQASGSGTSQHPSLQGLSPGLDSSSPNTPISDQSSPPVSGVVRSDHGRSSSLNDVKGDGTSSADVSNSSVGREGNVSYMRVLRSDGERNSSNNEGTAPGSQPGGTPDHRHVHHLQAQYELGPSSGPQLENGSSQTSSAAPTASSQGDPRVTFNPQGVVGTLLGINDAVTMNQHLQQHLSHQLGLAATDPATAAALLRLTPVQHQSPTDQSTLRSDSSTGLDTARNHHHHHHHHHHQQIIQNLRAAGYSSVEAANAASQLLGLTADLIVSSNSTSENHHNSDENDHDENVNGLNSGDSSESPAETANAAGMLTSI